MAHTLTDLRTQLIATHSAYLHAVAQHDEVEQLIARATENMLLDAWLLLEREPVR